MAAIYNVLELSTAVKPWLLRRLLARARGDGASSTSTPTSASTRRSTRSFQARARPRRSCSPRTSPTPMPRDGRKPNEQDILIAGAYNLGFIGLGSSAFADDAARLVGRAARAATASTTPSAASSSTSAGSTSCPALAEDFDVLRDPGFNVAYWNLADAHARASATAPGTSTATPAALLPLQRLRRRASRTCSSKHQDRIRLADEPGARASSARATRRSCSTHGFDEVSDWPYSYDASASGVPLDRLSRRIYRDARGRRRSTSSLFDAGGEARVRRRGGGRRGRAAASTASPATWRRCTTCAATSGSASPTSTPADGARLRRVGAHDSGATRCRSRELLPPRADRGAAAATRPPRAPHDGVDSRAAPAFGVNVVGYLSSELGVGEVARQVVDALDAVGVPALPVGLHRARQPAGPPLRHVGDLAATTPRRQPRLRQRRHAAGLRRAASAPRSSRAATRSASGGGRRRCSPSAGTRASTTSTSSGRAPSSWPRRSAAVSPKPVVHMPMPVTLPPVADAASARTLGLPEGFVFLLLYDLPQRLRAQEPARAARRVPARVPETRARARSWCSRASTPSGTRTSTTRCGWRPRATRTCTCSTSTSRPTRRTR